MVNERLKRKIYIKPLSSTKFFSLVPSTKKKKIHSDLRDDFSEKNNQFCRHIARNQVDLMFLSLHKSILTIHNILIGILAVGTICLNRPMYITRPGRGVYSC